MLGERLPWRGWIGIFLGLVGCVLCALYAPSAAVEDCEAEPDTYIHRSLISWRSLIYWSILLLACLYIANPLRLPPPYAVKRDTALRSAAPLCVLCSMLGTVQVSSSKGVALAITRGLAGHTAMLVDPALCWLSYLLVLTTVASIALHQKYMNLLLIHHDAGVVVPVHFFLWSVVTISAGTALFDETAFRPALGVPLFVAGISLSSLAVYLLEASPPDPPQPQAGQTPPGPGPLEADGTEADSDKAVACGSAGRPADSDTAIEISGQICFAEALPPPPPPGDGSEAGPDGGARPRLAGSA